jgi:hypothetical protein
VEEHVFQRGGEAADKEYGHEDDREQVFEYKLGKSRALGWLAHCVLTRMDIEKGVIKLLKVGDWMWADGNGFPAVRWDPHLQYLIISRSLNRSELST